MITGNFYVQELSQSKLVGESSTAPFIFLEVLLIGHLSLINKILSKIALEIKPFIFVFGISHVFMIIRDMATSLASKCKMNPLKR